jgi:hypothetical protein
MPPSRTISAAPLEEAVFEVSTQFAKVSVAVVSFFCSAFPCTATAPPVKAEFVVMVQSVAVTMESSSAATAPPLEAEFENIVHCAVTVEYSLAMIAPPPPDPEFKVIVQSAAVAIELPTAATAPPA